MNRKLNKFTTRKLKEGSSFKKQNSFHQTLRSPNSHWKSTENRKNFLDQIAKKLEIKTPSDWGAITVKYFYELGGGSLLNNYFNGSLFSCLQSVYKDVNWKREWFSRFPNAHWQSMSNRRKFLDEIAQKLCIKTPSDWGTITVQEFYELGGGSLLNNYNNSLFACLQSVYQDVHWKREWFSKLPHSFWQSVENHKKFLDELAKQLNIETSSDWGKISIRHFHELGGSSILRFYNGSLLECLQSVYKGIHWKREWFVNLSHFPKAYWSSAENCRKFLDEIARNSNVISPSDWRKVSLTLIRNNGGHGLIHKYRGSMQSILKAIYLIPNTNELSLLLPSERILGESLKSIFTEASIIPNCRNVHRLKI